MSSLFQSSARSIQMIAVSRLVEKKEGKEFSFLCSMSLKQIINTNNPSLALITLLENHPFVEF